MKMNILICFKLETKDHKTFFLFFAYKLTLQKEIMTTRKKGGKEISINRS